MARPFITFGDNTLATLLDFYQNRQSLSLKREMAYMADENDDLAREMEERVRKYDADRSFDSAKVSADAAVESTRLSSRATVEAQRLASQAHVNVANIQDKYNRDLKNLDHSYNVLEATTKGLLNTGDDLTAMAQSYRAAALGRAIKEGDTGLLNADGTDFIDTSSADYALRKYMPKEAEALRSGVYVQQDALASSLEAKALFRAGLGGPAEDSKYRVISLADLPDEAQIRAKQQFPDLTSDSRIIFRGKYDENGQFIPTQVEGNANVMLASYGDLFQQVNQVNIGTTAVAGDFEAIRQANVARVAQANADAAGSAEAQQTFLAQAAAARDAAAQAQAQAEQARARLGVRRTNSSTEPTVAAATSSLRSLQDAGKMPPPPVKNPILAQALMQQASRSDGNGPKNPSEVLQTNFGWKQQDVDRALEGYAVPGPGGGQNITQAKAAWNAAATMTGSELKAAENAGLGIGAIDLFREEGVDPGGRRALIARTPGAKEVESALKTEAKKRGITLDALIDLYTEQSVGGIAPSIHARMNLLSEHTGVTPKSPIFNTYGAIAGAEKLHDMDRSLAQNVDKNFRRYAEAVGAPNARSLADLTPEQRRVVAQAAAHESLRDRNWYDIPGRVADAWRTNTGFLSVPKGTQAVDAEGVIYRRQ